MTVTRMDPSGYRLMETVTIAAGQSLSAASVAGLQGYVLGSIELDAGFTGTGLSFQTAYTASGLFLPLKTDDMAEVTYTVAPSIRWAVPAELFRSYPVLKLQAGTNAAPVVQPSLVTCTLIFTRGLPA